MISGRHQGFSPVSYEVAVVVEQILAAKTAVLAVAMAAPHEHQFILRHRIALDGVSWIKSCGGMLKFLVSADQ